MQNSPFTETEYTRTYTSYSGADIKASFGDVVIGELNSITYSVTREKAPVFTFGDPNPRSFSRGKRGIAGSITFTVLDRDALTNIKSGSSVYRHGFNHSDDPTGRNQRPAHLDHETTMEQNIARWKIAERPHYADEIPPFDISISFLNEYGSASSMTIYGVELTNEGMGLSVDDITTEKAMSFVARSIDDMYSAPHSKLKNQFNS